MICTSRIGTGYACPFELSKVCVRGWGMVPDPIDFLTSGWDAAKVITATAGMITIFGGGYGLYWRITTAASRRLKMLHNYIEEREKSIAVKRVDVLQSIRLSEHFRGLGEARYHCRYERYAMEIDQCFSRLLQKARQEQGWLVTFLGEG